MDEGVQYCCSEGLRGIDYESVFTICGCAGESSGTYGYRQMGVLLFVCPLHAFYNVRLTLVPRYDTMNDLVYEYTCGLLTGTSNKQLNVQIWWRV